MAADGTARVSGDGVDATLRKLQGDQWELVLAARTSQVEEVRFPWWPPAAIAQGIADDWLLYISANTGAAAAAAEIRRGFGASCDSPGLCVSPILIWATAGEGFLAAATTWPPRHLRVAAGPDGFGFMQSSVVPAGHSVTLRVMLNSICEKPSSGREPWRDVLDPYLAWRREETRKANLVPSPPDWLVNADGWLNVQLQDMPAFAPDRLEALRQAARPLFTWVQLWGQMSNYAGPRHLAVPPLGVLEHPDCCAVDPSIHRRYVPSLREFVSRAASEGRVGLYLQPGPNPIFDEAGKPTPALAAFREWLRRNREEQGTNAVYVDVLGNRYYGDPLSVARFVKSELPPGTVIEFAEDLYPAAYLLSGALVGGVWDGAPGNTPEELGRGFRHGTFPRLGRYLIGDRTVFLGESNSDGRLWGRDHAYWGERQAFLLGAKFDSMHPFEGPPGSEQLDQAIAEAVAERRRVGWWQRDPVYLDRAGIYDLAQGVDVRRFRGRSGEDLLVIDNWERRERMSFSFEGRRVGVPTKRLSILLPSAADPDSPDASLQP